MDRYTFFGDPLKDAGDAGVAVPVVKIDCGMAVPVQLQVRLPVNGLSYVGNGGLPFFYRIVPGLIEFFGCCSP